MTNTIFEKLYGKLFVVLCGIFIVFTMFCSVLYADTFLFGFNPLGFIKLFCGYLAISGVIIAIMEIIINKMDDTKIIYKIFLSASVNLLYFVLVFSFGYYCYFFTLISKKPNFEEIILFLFRL